MSAADLWTAVKADYDTAGLITLTNIRNRGAVAVNDTVGESAAQAVINLWPIYAQVEYDAANAQHVEVAELGVIAMLWRRGGSASAIEKVKWDEVFGNEGAIARVRRTGPRGHAGPSSNSGVQTRSEMVNGRPIRGWSDPDSLPTGFLSTPRTADGD